MQVFLKVLLFFVLLTTGYCLHCETCVKVTSNSTANATDYNCHGPMKKCTATKDTCSIVHSVHNLGGATEHIVEKSCDFTKVCALHKMQFSVAKDRTYMSSVFCCNGKACPKDVQPLIPGKTIPNGKVCPGCFAWSKTCDEKTIKCTGGDTNCIDLRMTRIKRPDGTFVDGIMKGCTSDLVCLQIKEDKTPLFTGEVNEVECNPKVSKGSQPTSFFLATVSGLLVMKIFG